MTLPVYYYWTFSTGGPGDFSILVRELTANPIPDTVVLRDMDVSDVSGGMAPIGMESALTTAHIRRRTCPADQLRVSAQYSAAVTGPVNTVRPPLYGSAYTGAPPYRSTT